MCLLTVFKIIPNAILLNTICLVITSLTFLILDINMFKKVDYALLLTFVCFFIFVGNIARIDIVKNFFDSIMQGNEILVSALLSQVISNVPAAVMLSGFTENAELLMLGVNIGGLGTPVASLASLISYQFYMKSENSKPKEYLLTFLAVNFAMLIILLGITLIIK